MATGASANDAHTRLGSPFLAWPSIFGQDSDAYVDVIFADAERPVGIGRFVRVKVGADGKLTRDPTGPVVDHRDDPSATWYLHVELARDFTITDERDWLAPGEWTLRLLVGADDGDGHAYELDVAWDGDEQDAHAVLGAALDRCAVRRVKSPTARSS